MKRLGDILLELGAISEDQLLVALQEQKIVGKRLGDYLVDSEMISERTLQLALAKQFSYGIADLRPDSIDYSLASKCDYEFLRKHKLLPYSCSGDKIFIATVDPVDVDGMNEIAAMFSKEPAGMVALPRELLVTFDGLKEYEDSISLENRVEKLEKQVAFLLDKLSELANI